VVSLHSAPNKKSPRIAIRGLFAFAKID